MRQPLVAVATYVWNRCGSHFLIAERLAGKCQGLYNLPGGHLEWMEPPIAGAMREVHEEVGGYATNFAPLTFDYGYDVRENHCWVVLFFCAQYMHKLPMNPEPDKNGDWKWVTPKELPNNILKPLLRNAPKAQEWAEFKSVGDKI